MFGKLTGVFSTIVENSAKLQNLKKSPKKHLLFEKKCHKIKPAQKLNKNAKQTAH